MFEYLIQDDLRRIRNKEGLSCLRFAYPVPRANFTNQRSRSDATILTRELLARCRAHHGSERIMALKKLMHRYTILNLVHAQTSTGLTMSNGSILFTWFPPSLFALLLGDFCYNYAVESVNQMFQTLRSVTTF